MSAFRHGRSSFGDFSAECDRLGLLYKMDEIIQASRRGYGTTQLSFF
jgi:hypothetical protein